MQQDQSETVPVGRRLSVKGGFGAAVVVVIVVGLATPAVATRYSYGCHSALSSSSTTYFVEGDVPAQVVQGSVFELDNVVLTGTVPQDLLIDELTFELDEPLAVSPMDGLSRFWTHDGLPPVTPDGSTNSTPEMTFTFLASGPVGAKVKFYPANVSSVVQQPGHPEITLAVQCERIGGRAFAETEIVAPAAPAPVPAPAAAAPAAVDVLGTGAGIGGSPVAQAVSTTPTLTG